MPQPAPKGGRIEKSFENLNHTCHKCKEFIKPDELAIWREDDEHVWFVHQQHIPSE